MMPVVTEENHVAELRRSLEASENRFNNVVNNAPDALVITDEEGIILFVNPAALELFGRSREQLVGKSFGFPVVSGDTTEIEVLHAVNHSVVAEMRVSPLEWNNKPALMASLRDMSVRIRLTNDLRRSNKDLEEFAAVISHDIKAPLRNLHLLAGWLKDDHATELNTDALDDIELMRSTTTRMQRMVDDLIQYSRVSSKQKLSPDIELNAVLNDALSNLSEQIFSSDAEITSDPLPSIDCNAVQMVRLFENLIANAIAYCSFKPVINITAELQGKFWCLRFADNGIGIEEKYLDKVFIPFNHLHSKESYDGTGVGLATCRKIVERHDGEIWLESETGVGTVAHVRLPAKAPSIQERKMSV